MQEIKCCDILKQSAFESVWCWNEFSCSTVEPLLEPEAFSDQEVPQGFSLLDTVPRGAGCRNLQVLQGLKS